jgi:hypothetical protein
MGDGKFYFNIVKEKKEKCYGVHNTEDNIPHHETMEENCGQNVLLAVQEEDCYDNMGEIRGKFPLDYIWFKVQLYIAEFVFMVDPLNG